METRAYRPARNIFAGFSCLAKNVIGFCLRRRPVLPAISECRSDHGRSRSFSARQDFIILQPAPASRGSSTASTPRGWPPVPGVPLQLGQVVERVGAAQLAGVNQAHEQVAHLRPVQRPIEQCVLAVQHRPLQCPFDDVVVQRRPSLPQKQSSMAVQCRSRYVIALPSPEFGSVFRSANCASSQSMQLLHHRPAVLLMKPQPLLRRQAALTRFGIVAVHLAQHLQHVTAFARESSAPLPQTAAFRERDSSPAESPLRCGSFGTLRDSASHIWIGGGSSAARCFSTSAMFSPACWRPVKYSAIFRPSPVETMPLVNTPVRSSPARAPASAPACWCRRCAAPRPAPPAGSVHPAPA